MVAETASTNADLLRAADQGAAHRSVLRADHQTAGRGRLDRTWDAPPGANLLMSMLLREVPEVPFELTQRVGLAAVAAAAELAGVDARLKWPNDVIVGDAKLAGILAQATSGLAAVVIGLGMNLAWCPPGAARLGPHLHPDDALDAVLAAYDALPDDIGPVYRANLATLHREVSVTTPTGQVHGVADDVDHLGRLVVRTADGTTVTFASGDVVHARQV